MGFLKRPIASNYALGLYTGNLCLRDIQNYILDTVDKEEIPPFVSPQAESMPSGLTVLSKTWEKNVGIHLQ